jgi:hypothetical protein
MANKANPFRTRINGETYILGRYADKRKKNEYYYYAVLICTKDGNRFIEPITVSEKKWNGMCLGNSVICKETIQMIKDTAERERR